MEAMLQWKSVTKGLEIDLPGKHVYGIQRQ